MNGLTKTLRELMVILDMPHACFRDPSWISRPERAANPQLKSRRQDTGFRACFLSEEIS